MDDGALPDGVGPFGVEDRTSRLAAGALWIAVVAAAAALVRPLASLAGIGTGSGVRAFGRPAVLLGVAAVLAGLAALYVTDTRGLGGRRAARAGIAAGAVVAVFAFVDGAVRDGTFDLARFGRQYFDADILRTLPGDLLRGALNTIKLAAVAEALAIAAGLVVATFVLSSNAWLRYPAVAYVDLVRGLPLVVLTFLVNFGLPNVGVTLNAFVSPVVILTINASAYVAEIFRAGIQSLPPGQMQAARSLGMPHATAMRTVIVPQATRSVIPPLVSEFIALIKDTAIVMALIGFTVASRDLFGAAAQAQASTFSPTPYMAAAFVYLAMTVPLARLVGRLERRMRAKVA